MPNTRASQLKSLWDDAACNAMPPADLLVHRSRLLGSDLRITNYGGGNTSSKIVEKDPLTGEDAEVLWVKGSGGDLGSISRGGFSTLYLDKLVMLKSLYRGREHEDEMVGYLPHCTFNLNPRAASIDTPLHAFIPHPHVDHMHPDAIIALAASTKGEKIVRELFGERIGWVAWQRPGFDLGLKLEEFCTQHPEAEGCVLAGHGLFTWGDTQKECYERTVEAIRLADEYLQRHAPKEPFGGAATESKPTGDRHVRAAKLGPVLRGKLSAESPKVGHFDDSEDVREFVNSNDLDRLAALGTSCPDHFLRTKIRPLVLREDEDVDARIAEYREDYEAYYNRCNNPDSPAMRDPYPVLVLMPGVGMWSFAKDKATARIASEYYINAIHVMAGAEAIGKYVGLSEQEAFDIEYWALEQAKLDRMPKPESLAGRVAFITGGAGGIGGATARRLLAEGAAVVITDLDADVLQEAEAELVAASGRDNVRALIADVTNEDSVQSAALDACREYGGIDILVSNAGIASASPVDETSLEVWNRTLGVLATGYFLVSREVFRVMKAQGAGGSIVFVGSKNALAASPSASAYCTAKAAELHLSRCLALEGAPHGIRSNVVNPDAVLRGSRIWQGKWRAERAEAMNVDESELEEVYRNRSLLKRSVYPEDIAEAICFFATSQSAKSTGNILNVDAGNPGAFTR